MKTGQNKNHEYISGIANGRGGKILTIIHAMKDYATFECEKGHQFRTRASNVKGGSWCKFCGYKTAALKKTKSIDEAHRLAKERGGKCSSEIYLGAKLRYRFECENGHIFRRAIYEVKNGKWCIQCERLKPVIPRKFVLNP